MIGTGCQGCSGFHLCCGWNCIYIGITLCCIKCCIWNVHQNISFLFHILFLCFFKFRKSLFCSIFYCCSCNCSTWFCIISICSKPVINTFLCCRLSNQSFDSHIRFFCCSIHCFFKICFTSKISRCLISIRRSYQKFFKFSVLNSHSDSHIITVPLVIWFYMCSCIIYAICRYLTFGYCKCSSRVGAHKCSCYKNCCCYFHWKSLSSHKFLLIFFIFKIKNIIRLYQQTFFL